MKTNFKVGDKVWDGVHYHGQEGKVIEANNTYLTIKFKQTALVQYFTDGRIAMSGTLPTLSKAPYTFEIPEQPAEFKEGDPVLVRDSEEFPWIGSKFKRYDNHGFQYVVFESSGYRIAHKYCIPFDIEKMGRV